jgi:CRP/FNR family transcriptional regulator, anaerobic regulatory protein
MKEIETILANLGKNLVLEILAHSVIRNVPRDTEILQQGAYVKVIPVVISGLIKVFTSVDDRELLLYYIKPGESCIMSFAAGLNNEPSKIFAVTDDDTKALLMPVAKVNTWIKSFPELNSLFYQQYNLRYTELLETINHVIFSKLDVRLFDYLKEKSKLTNQNPVKISHRQIASELGTAREVISRVIKKLENEGKVRQNSGTIEML